MHLSKVLFTLAVLGLTSQAQASSLRNALLSSTTTTAPVVEAEVVAEAESKSTDVSNAEPEEKSTRATQSDSSVESKTTTVAPKAIKEVKNDEEPKADEEPKGDEEPKEPTDDKSAASVAQVGLLTAAICTAVSISL